MQKLCIKEINIGQRETSPCLTIEIGVKKKRERKTKYTELISHTSSFWYI